MIEKKISRVNSYFKCLFEKKNCLSVCLSFCLSFFLKVPTQRMQLRSNDLVNYKTVNFIQENYNLVFHAKL